MVIVAYAYKTQQNVFDHVVAHILVTGLIGQLKGWWDNYISKEPKKSNFKCILEKMVKSSEMLSIGLSSLYHNIS